MSAYAAHAARGEEWLPVRLKVALAALCGALCGLLYGLAVLGLHTAPAASDEPVASRVAHTGTAAGSRVAGALTPAEEEREVTGHRAERGVSRSATPALVQASRHKTGEGNFNPRVRLDTSQAMRDPAVVTLDSGMVIVDCQRVPCSLLAAVWP